MRIGAAQDMMVAGFDALAIMQAGGWRSASVVLRYVENASMRELHERKDCAATILGYPLARRGPLLSAPLQLTATIHAMF